MKAEIWKQILKVEGFRKIQKFNPEVKFYAK